MMFASDCGSPDVVCHQERERDRFGLVLKEGSVSVLVTHNGYAMLMTTV
jgi:hypothetical protein